MAPAFSPVCNRLVEEVAEEIFRGVGGYGRHWKPLTRKVNRG